MNWTRETVFPRDPVTGVIRGAEPFDFPPPGNLSAGAHAVLFLHGWTSSPRELRFVAERLSHAGFHCRGILLPGHGTTVADLEPTRFEDYLAAAEKAFDALAASHEKVSLCGLSMGGLLCLYLAARRKAANLVLYAPFLSVGGRTLGLPNRWVLPALGFLSASNRPIQKSDPPIFHPEAWKEHIAYPAMPLQGILGNVRAARRVWPLVRELSNPALVFHSPHDPTSDISGSERLMRELGSKEKRMVVAERSKHILTLDYDREMVEAETVRWMGA